MGNPSSAPPRTPQLRRAVASAFVGSVIEYYDFLLYATASAVVFDKVFFSNLDPLVAMFASFGTFATGYLARPLGGIIFGHFGDRLGRKQMLVLTMTLMGVASFLIGLLPTSRRSARWRRSLLVLLRVFQGIAVGGEWGGAVLMSAEHATGRRGLWASFTNAGAPSAWCSPPPRSADPRPAGEEAFLAGAGGCRSCSASSCSGRPVRAAAGRGDPGLRRGQGRARPPGAAVRRAAPPPATSCSASGVGLGAFVVQGTLTTYLIAYGGAGRLHPAAVLNGLTLSSRAGRDRHPRLVGALRPRRAAGRRHRRRAAHGGVRLRPVPDGGQRQRRRAHPRARDRPGGHPPDDVRPARRALRRALRHPEPATPGPRSATSSPASAPGSPRCSSPRSHAATGSSGNDR